MFDSGKVLTHFVLNYLLDLFFSFTITHSGCFWENGTESNTSLRVIKAWLSSCLTSSLEQFYSILSFITVFVNNHINDINFLIDISVRNFLLTARALQSSSWGSRSSIQFIIIFNFCNFIKEHSFSLLLLDDLYLVTVILCASVFLTSQFLLSILLFMVHWLNVKCALIPNSFNLLHILINSDLPHALHLRYTSIINQFSIIARPWVKVSLKMP